MEGQMILALKQDAYAKIELAKMNMQILMLNPVGVGDHPNVMETIQGQLDIIAANQDRLSILLQLQDQVHTKRIDEESDE